MPATRPTVRPTSSSQVKSDVTTLAASRQGSRKKLKLSVSPRSPSSGEPEENETTIIDTDASIASDEDVVNATSPMMALKGSGGNRVDPDAELVALKRKSWRSPIYTFFKLDAVTTEYIDGRLAHFFPCGADNCKYAAGGVRRYQDSKDCSSTANLKHHALVCWGKESVDNACSGKTPHGPRGGINATAVRQGKNQPIHRTRYVVDNDEIRIQLVRWITVNNHPLSVIDDRALRDLLTAGRPSISLPSRENMSRDILRLFEECRQRIGIILQDHPGRIHIATDTWTSPNHRAFVAWTVHLEQNGKILCFLLDVIEIPKSHNGVTLARMFQELLERYGLTKKILAVNASLNNTQTRKLAKSDNSFEATNRAWCFKRTIQLAAKALLRPLRQGISSNGDEMDVDMPAPQDDDASDDDDLYKSADESADDTLSDLDDEDNESGADESTDDPDDHIDELEILHDREKENIMTETVIIRDAVTKARKLSLAITQSSMLSTLWRTRCKNAGLKAKLIPRDVAARWSSTYEMLSFAVRYREVIDKITVDKRAPQLRKHQLRDVSWKVIEDLVAILERYKQAAAFFSTNSASIAAVIPATDKLDHSDLKSHEDFSPAILSAMKLARNKMDRYRKATYGFNVYGIAMVLHPGLKLDYFRAHHYEDEQCINIAEDIVREEWKVHYKDQFSLPDVVAAPTKENGRDHNATEDFGNISLATASLPKDELDVYLREFVETVRDPLQWWIDNKQKYPNLHRMALDYLSVPATSAAVELAFSKGRQLLYSARSEHSGNYIRASMCLGSWLRHDLVSSKDSTAVLRQNNRRASE